MADAEKTQPLAATTTPTPPQLDSEAETAVAPPLDKETDAGVSPSKHTDPDAEAHAGASPAWVHPRAHMPAYQWPLFMVGLLLGGLLYGLDTTIAADVQVPVYQTFGDIENLPWVGLGFPMAAVSVILLLSRAFALFNTKYLVVSSVALFEVGSALCGGAPNSPALIVGRVIAGIGGCGMYLGGLSYVNTFAVGKEVPLYNALIGLSWGLGAILGPLVGGGFSVSSATWRWSFYLNLPLCGLCCPIYIFLFPLHDPRPDLPVRQKIRQVDWVGGLLFIPVITLFMTAITFAGSKYAWDSAATIAMLFVWLACLAAFVLQQRFAWCTTPRNRVFPVWVLASRDMVLLFCVTLLSSVGSTVPLFYVPLFFQFTQPDASALLAAVRLLPFIVIYIFFIMLAGVLLPVVGRYAPFYLVGGLLLVPGRVLFLTGLRADASTAAIYGYEVLLAAGAGLTMQNGYAVAASKAADTARVDFELTAGVDSETERQHAATRLHGLTSEEAVSAAAGFINIGQMGSSALSLALCAVLFQNLGFHFLKDELAPYGLSDALLRQILAGASSSAALGGVDTSSALYYQLETVVVDTIAYTMSREFALVVVAGGLMVVASGLLKWEKIKLDFTAGA